MADREGTVLHLLLEKECTAEKQRSASLCDR